MFKKATCICFLLLTTFRASAQQQANPDSLYDIQDSVLIKTRDGHRIASIIVMKKGSRQHSSARFLPTMIMSGSLRTRVASAPISMSMSLMSTMAMTHTMS